MRTRPARQNPTASAPFSPSSARAADAADKGRTDRALDLLLDARWGPGWRDRLPRPRLAAVRRHAGAIAPLLTALDAYIPTRDDLRAVTVPTLVLHRAAPPLTRLIAERLAAALPHAQLAAIDPDAEPSAALAPSSALAVADLSSLVLAFLATLPGEPSPA